MPMAIRIKLIFQSKQHVMNYGKINNFLFCFFIMKHKSIIKCDWNCKINEKRFHSHWQNKISIKYPTLWLFYCFKRYQSWTLRTKSYHHCYIDIHFYYVYLIIFSATYYCSSRKNYTKQTIMSSLMH